MTYLTLVGAYGIIEIKQGLFIYQNQNALALFHRVIEVFPCCAMPTKTVLIVTQVGTILNRNLCSGSELLE